MKTACQCAFELHRLNWNGDPSSQFITGFSCGTVAEHVYKQTPPHEIDWNNIKIIDRVVRRTERKIRESYAISMKKPVMNRNEGYERSTTWNTNL